MRTPPFATVNAGSRAPVCLSMIAATLGSDTGWYR